MDLEDFKHGGTRITSLRLLTSYKDTVQTKIQEQDIKSRGRPMKVGYLFFTPLFCLNLSSGYITTTPVAATAADQIRENLTFRLDLLQYTLLRAMLLL